MCRWTNRPFVLKKAVLPDDLLARYNHACYFQRACQANCLSPADILSTGGISLVETPIYQDTTSVGFSFGARDRETNGSHPRSGCQCREATKAERQVLCVHTCACVCVRALTCRRQRPSLARGSLSALSFPSSLMKLNWCIFSGGQQGSKEHALKIYCPQKPQG